MIHLIALTSDLAATIFTGIPCTDGSHFDLPSSVRPGDWESKDAKRGEKQGHRRCKFPKKHVVVDGKTGEFAIVHSKYSSLAGFRMLRPTREILQFFLDKRLNISMASERGQRVKSLANREKGLQGQDECWEVVESVEAEEEYVVV